MQLSLRQKLVISFSLAFCVIIAGFGILILHNNGERYQAQSYAYCRRIVQANISLIDKYLGQLKTVTQIVASDQDILNAVNYRENNRNIDYSVELYSQRRVSVKIKQFDVLRDVQNAVIIGSDGTYLYYYGESPVPSYNFKQQKWFREAADGDKSAFINYHPTDYLLSSNDGRQTVSLLLPILNSSQFFYGQPTHLLCDFGLEPIILHAERDDEVQIAIYSGSEPVYFPSQFELSKDQMDTLSHNIKNGEHSFVLNGEKGTAKAFLVVVETSQVSGWSMLGIMPLDSINALRQTNTMFVVFLMLAAFVLILLVSNLLARSVLVPMNALINTFNAIGRGEKGVHFEKTSSMEVDRIAQTAMQMLQKNDELTAAVVQESQQRAQAQIRALQHQINPHFLNNLLQSMKALAICGDTETISKMTTLLGKLLAYSVYNPYEMVPLEKEFEHTGIYIALQNIRFENKIVCTQHLADEAKDILVPKLIIQPLAENAIEHGFSAAEGGQITLSADVDEDEICIVVTNTGQVINPERVEELNSRLHQKSADAQNTSIGLLNVRARICSSFGEAADLQIMSRNGMNTSIVLSLPRRKEDD
ncbi:histidine kinase [Hydrogenoanaerobacterium sp.]|uniref:cache domain-containing sensor histidine kinase n=1 Tax=Hydrogenoanaerobacterium sp. TaxID=2953763 RepID=UPI00289A93A1|nr:histidine kinase [Hydrogenoanaerobacterium sp.]